MTKSKKGSSYCNQLLKTFMRYLGMFWKNIAIKLSRDSVVPARIAEGCKLSESEQDSLILGNLIFSVAKAL